jgi:hypothetical protein
MVQKLMQVSLDIVSKKVEEHKGDMDDDDDEQ